MPPRKFLSGINTSLCAECISARKLSFLGSREVSRNDFCFFQGIFAQLYVHITRKNNAERGENRPRNRHEFGSFRLYFRGIQKATLSVSAKIMKYEIKKLRVYEDDKIFYELNDINTKSIDLKIPLNGCNATKIIRVEIEGLNEHHICVSTPFYIK